MMKKVPWNFIICFCFLAFLMQSAKVSAQITVGVELNIRESPPPLPVYGQPQCPQDGFLWTPGYWAYSSDGYYWVPGVWVRPPHYGYLWTPCYWGFSGGYYGFHAGYWGPHIGYYGGVNYGYGYGGSGYYGGRWEGNNFRYNTAVVNINTTVVHNTYVDRTVIVNNPSSSRASFNGPGGINTRPNAQEEQAMRESHTPATTEQNSHQQVASRDRSQLASVNKGHPTTAAMNKVGGQGYNPKGKQLKSNATNTGHPSAPASSNPKHDQTSNNHQETHHTSDAQTTHKQQNPPKHASPHKNPKSNHKEENKENRR